MAAPTSLQGLVEDGVVDHVESQLMSGKEAAVYVVSYRGQLVAAKVYKNREQRTFKATASYTEGRNQTRNTRDKRAMGKRTSYGRELIEESWRDMEYRALFDAMHGGVRVPKPIMLYDDVLLMELVVDADGVPASRLADFEIAPEDAEPLHHEIYRQVRMLLGTGKVHGDLSAFNILMAEAGPTIIDMPQVVDAAGNNQARDILRRDLRNVTEHLARFDARLLRFRHCGDALWHHFQQGTLDQATRPQEGAVRSDRAGGGRRAALAQSGRMGRGGDRPRGGGPHGGHDRGAPQGGPRHDRPAPQGGPRHDRPAPQGGPRHDRPAPHGGPRDDRPSHHAAQHGGPRHDRPPQGGPRHDRPAPQGGPRHDRPAPQGGPRHDRPAPQGGPRHDRPAPHGDRPAQQRADVAMAPGRPKGRPERAPVQVDYVRRSTKPR